MMDRLPENTERPSVAAEQRRTLLLAALLAGAAPAAFGHAGLVSSEPGQRAELTVPPKQIRLCFNERVEVKFSSVSLVDANAKKIPLGAVQADAAKPSCVLAPLAALAVGRYTVKFRVLSVDGHVVEKSYGFSLKAP